MGRPALRNAIIILYGLLGISFIVADITGLALTGFIIKLLLMPFLAIYLFLSAENFSNRLLYTLSGALFFSWAGDVLLEYQWSQASLFVPGLLCFLTAHILYVFLFIRGDQKKVRAGKLILPLSGIIIYGVALNLYLYEGLGIMKVPVIIYATVILTMLAAAFIRYSRKNSNANLQVFFGALLFVISDSLLAINRFGDSFSIAGPLIMSTYLVAQFLIVKGIVEGYNKGN